MKKLAIFALVATLMIVPRVTFAAWWNPLSWFSQPEPIEMLVPPEDLGSDAASSTPTGAAGIPESTNSDSDSVIAKLHSQINGLNQENTSLRNQLATAEAKYQQCISQGTTTVSNQNDEAASKLRVELATLDQVDKELDTKAENGEDDLIEFLNTEKKLDGTPLFPIPPKSVTHIWDFRNVATVTLDGLHSDVDDYRTILKIDLAQYEDIPN